MNKKRVMGKKIYISREKYNTEEYVEYWNNDLKNGKKKSFLSCKEILIVIINPQVR